MPYAYLVAYDGLRFYGFTGHRNSVEPALAKAIGPIASKASRTDPGVSALANVVVSPSLKPLGQINASLPRGLWVWGIAEVDDGFDARRAAVARTYAYFAPYRGEDVGEIKSAASLFVGTRDLRSFAKGVQRAVTTIYSIEVRDRGAAIELRITGRAFKNKMVRKVAWALLAVGRGLITPEELEELVLGLRARPIPNAPAEGLVLISAHYSGIKFGVDENILAKIHKYFLDRYRIFTSMSVAYEEILKGLLSYWRVSEEFLNMHRI
ncbi:MAG: tRNA pseudouridine(38-40) synthase TruA [Thermoproteus sp. AZ2]|uniref:tRNA pseudouridine(38-40) synthase TruA n=1 Tax=Thermoproteus sp. AZ2 TaxID=1609232 RepID=A0ACC6UZ01_9CREN|nr:MAG: tRNA pseudouridine synthase ACD [Thermoproteus sp. AZ2]